MACKPYRAWRSATVLAACGLLLIHIVPVTAQTHCLSPAAEQTLKDLMATGTLTATLGADLTLTGVSLTGTSIALRAANANGQPYGIELTLPGSSDRPPDGRGQRFVFHVLPAAAPPSPEVVQVLLATAALIDTSVPESAFADCSGQLSSPPPGGEPVRDSLYYPRSSALSGAMLQVLILVAATLFGWRAIRSS